MRSLFLLGFVLLASSTVRAEEVCKSCWNSSCAALKDLGLPRCKPVVKTPVPTTPAPASACPTGKSRSADTAGHCCWSGQGWNGAACVGRPLSCPEHYVIDADQCSLPACSEGKQRTVDGVHCCWPNQAWQSATSQCVGTPKCAAGWDLVDTSEPTGARCRSPAEREAAELEVRRLKDDADAQERERVRLEQLELERKQKEEADRIEQQKKAKRQQLEQQRVTAIQAAWDDERSEVVRRRGKWMEARAAASNSRSFGYVSAGLGGALGGVTALCMYLGSASNDAVTSGDAATASDITSASIGGTAANVAAYVSGAGALLGVTIGVPLIALNLDQGDFTEEEPTIESVAQRFPPVTE